MGDIDTRQSTESAAQIEPEVRRIVGEILEMEGRSIDLNAQLVEDLGMDSMKALEILAALEKRFRIRIPEDQLLRMTTLRSIIDVALRYANR